MESDNIEILWDFTIQVDWIIEAERPQLVVINKQTN